MTLTIEGVYRAGKVELTQTAPAEDGTRVLVSFPVSQDDTAMRQERLAAMFRRMEKGIDFGGSAFPTREEIYERDNP